MQLKIISIKAKKKVSKTYSKGKEKVCYILHTLTETIFNPVFWLQTQSQGCVREKRHANADGLFHTSFDAEKLKQISIYRYFIWNSYTAKFISKNRAK